MNELVLPDPQTTAISRIAEVIATCRSFRQQCRDNNDTAAAQELHRRINAFTKYVQDKKAKSALEGEARLTECLIGELLGEATNKGPATFASCEGLVAKQVDKDDRSRFRSLADHSEQVQELVAKGVVQRSKILAAIARSDQPPINVTASIDIRHGDFRTVLSDIQHGTLDAIVTDPPYPKEFLPLFKDLGELAARTLKPGGILAVMTGQSYLPDVITTLSRFLDYHWTLAYLTPGGQSAQIWQRKVNTFWKPVLVFVKGNYTGAWFGDVAKSPANNNDKEHHHWGQSEAGMNDIFNRIIPPNLTVCDPFLGGGTTAIVAAQRGHPFIGCDTDAACIRTTKERLGVA